MLNKRIFPKIKQIVYLEAVFIFTVKILIT